MRYKDILITGGAGFVGSNLAVKLKQHYTDINVFALDNLKRRGSELNLPRLKQHGITFIHGDIRNKEDFNFGAIPDLIIDCSAEPSVMAGMDGSPEYVINTNLMGTINCVEFARIWKADFLFLSTSRVYSVTHQNALNLEEGGTRFIIKDQQTIPGVSFRGISESFPFGAVRSFYGTTKLCCEHILNEYADAYGLNVVINRCGVITGPWQMGKVDQGVVVLWVARHVWANKPLSYIGYGGKGKQVRDFIHIDDLFEAIKIQLENFDEYKGDVYNIGGGLESSASLLEMTNLCRDITGNTINIWGVMEDRKNDVPIYISDYSKFNNKSGWMPCRRPIETFVDIYRWIEDNKQSLEPILN